MNTQLQNHPQWTSPIIQNEPLEICADLVSELICIDVKESCRYGIIIEETSDISRDQQLSFCLSYIANGSHGNKETLFGFHATKTTDGETLYKPSTSCSWSSKKLFRSNTKLKSDVL